MTKYPTQVEVLLEIVEGHLGPNWRQEYPGFNDLSDSTKKESKKKEPKVVKS
jgi:hypothetical protein